MSLNAFILCNIVIENFYYFICKTKNITFKIKLYFTSYHGHFLVYRCSHKLGRHNNNKKKKSTLCFCINSFSR